MKPYAYSINCDRHYYYSNRVFPSFSKAVLFLRENSVPAELLLTDLKIVSHFENGEITETNDVSEFVVENEVDRDEIAKIIDEKIKLSIEFWKSLEGQIVTGSRPLFLEDRDKLIENEIKNRRYSWR
jgi:hypothetical protein